MNRRKFLIISTTGVAALAIPVYYQFLNKNIESDPLIYPQFLSQIWHEDSIKLIGSIYLNQVPKENNKEMLVKLILGNVSSSNSNLKKVIESQIKKDFETEHVIMVDGWVLSMTEVRQCALYSLTKA